MKFFMYSAVFWAAINYVAIRMHGPQIIENGWLTRAKPTDPVLGNLMFILLMFIPGLRVFFFGVILYMASTREEDSKW